MRPITLKTAEYQLGIRSLEPRDIASIIQYWATSPREHLRRMGVDETKLPSAEQTRDLYLENLSTPDREKSFCPLIWEVEGRSIGFTTLKRIRYGEEGEVHLHMWEVGARKRGHGTVLFCHSVIVFADRFALTRVICEPAAENPAPNRLMTRLGLSIARSYPHVASEICFETVVNRYEIDPDRMRNLARSLPASFS